MVQIRQDCDCKTCSGGSIPEKGVFGGWKCICPCHESGFPIDSKEHMQWMKDKNREYLKSIDRVTK